MPGPESWTDHPDVDVAAINADLETGVPTADVAIHYPSNLDPAHYAKVNPQLLVDGFVASKKIFGDVGVQLRLVTFRTGELDPKLFAVNSTDGSHLPGGRFVNMYVGAERNPSRLSDEAEAAFNAIVADEPGADLVVHIVTLQDVFMEFYDQIDFRTWRPRLISTGGLSFPGYMYGDTMPRHLRGVITITDLVKGETSWKTLAHELGHKLLNVSHEYRETSPQHEVNADGGLMLYGEGGEIPPGAEGRYHYERLHKSPYLYTEAEDGSRTYNPDYAAGGFYYDPIYDGISMEFE